MWGGCGHGSWLRPLEEVIVQNRQLRQQQYAERRKQDQREALQRDQDLLVNFRRGSMTCHGFFMPFNGFPGMS